MVTALVLSSASVILPSASEDITTFVGVTACTGCHPREFELWRRSHHAAAMQVATPTSVLGDFSAGELAFGGGATRFHRNGDEFLVLTEGPDGKRSDFAITYTIGVSPLQQYLVAKSHGRLQAFGIAWDSRPKEAGGQRWFHLYSDRKLEPGSRLHWTGRDQVWNYQCAACHSTDLRKNYDLSTDSYATMWSDMNVACEACHGPGSKHVAQARGAATGIAERTARSGDSELDMCFPCHARRKPITENPAVGAGFLDHYMPALLEPGLYHSDGQIDGEVFEYGSFLQSRMYRAGVRFSDCHDPHSSELRASGNALCGRCHLPDIFDTAAHHHHRPDGEGARCIACHMPTKTYMGVDERRDHGFKVPRPDLSVAIGTPNACTSCHVGETAAWAARKIEADYPGGRWTEPHFGVALDAGRRGSVEAERRLAELVRDGNQPAIARASALALLPPFATGLSQPAVRFGLADPSPLVRMAAARALGPSPTEPMVSAALPRLRDPVRAVRIEAARALAGIDLRSFGDARQKDFADAYRELVAAELADSDRPEAHLTLGLLEMRQGRPEVAQRHYATALRLDPKFVPALVDLADFFRVRGENETGEKWLRRALEIEPGNADVHHALGLGLVRRKLYTEALDALRAAHELAPDNARYAYVYAVALSSTGARRQAENLLEVTHARHPADRDVLVALVSFARERADLAGALDYAKKLATLAPLDRGVQRLLRDLETTQPR
jgi:Flp pilus assembly protein TadD